MIFKVNIGTLTNTVNGYGNTSEILVEQNSKVNSAIKELTDLGWSGKAKDEFLKAHKIRQDKFILLQKEIEYMKYVLEKIEKPEALELKRECENFVNYIERIGQGGALTGSDVGTISFNGEPTPINRNVNNCVDDDYKKISSNMKKIMNIVDSLKYTSFGAGQHISSEVETSIKNQTKSLTDFDQGFNLYYNSVRNIESNICSAFSKISGVNNIAGFKSSSVITPSGEVDKNKVKEILLKNSGNLSDEDKQTLRYLDRVLGDKKYTELINEVIEDERAEVEKQKKANIKQDFLNLFKDNLKDIFRGDPMGQVEDAWKNLNNLYEDTGVDEYLKSKFGEENYNKFASGINSVEDFIDNPLKDMNKLNDYLENSEAGKYLKEHDKMQYDNIKMKIIRGESIATDAINMGKGIKSLHDLLSYDMDVGDQSIKIQAEKALGIDGMDDEETYKKALNANQKDMENVANMSWDAVKGIGTGIVEDAKTTLDVKKAIDWFTNPDMKLEDAQEWSQAAINTAMTVDGVRSVAGFVKGKFVKVGEVGAEAGIEAGLETPKASDIAKNIETNLENSLKNIEKQDVDINDFDIKDADADIDATSIEESLDTQTEISNKNIKAEDFTNNADEVSNNIDKVDVSEAPKSDISDVKVEDNSGEVSKVEENATDINEKNIKTEDTTGSAKKAADDVDKITKDETEISKVKDGDGTEDANGHTNDESDISNVTKDKATITHIITKIMDYVKNKIEALFEYVTKALDLGDKIRFKTKDGEVDIPKDQLTKEEQDYCLNGCFTGDTLVSTKEGLKRIDQINEGDLILAKDIQTGEINYKPVITVYRKTTNKLVILNVEGEEIKTTPTHLFFANGWWKAAENLELGDSIITSDGSLKIVTSVKVENLESPKRIYNLNIDEYHTYFVSSLSLLVHNDYATIKAKIEEILSSEKCMDQLEDLATKDDGCHGLTAHVGKDLPELQEMAKDRSRGVASSFETKDDALLAIKEILEKRKDQIATWLKQKKPDFKKTFEGDVSVSGYGVFSPGDTEITANTNIKATIVLVVDKSEECGFKILTVYPIVK